jgi:PIN domain nuclease of toxin-antitoxin system
MNLLLDSHVLLWALHNPDRLSSEAREAIIDPTNLVFFSAASAWELEIKAAKGKLTLPSVWLQVAIETGFVEIPVSSVDAQRSAHLPPHHSDPFDRLLVAQVMAHQLHLATRDGMIAAYGVPILTA